MTEENGNETKSTGQSKDEKKLAAFLKSDRVPSNEIEVTVSYDPVGTDEEDEDGNPICVYKTCVIHFTRSIDAYDRYISSVGMKAARGANPLVIAGARQFILDTVDPSHRELIAGENGFLTAYPGEAITIATKLCDAYTVPGGIEEIKNE